MDDRIEIASFLFEILPGNSKLPWLFAYNSNTIAPPWQKCPKLNCGIVRTKDGRWCEGEAIVLFWRYNEQYGKDSVKQASRESAIKMSFSSQKKNKRPNRNTAQYKRNGNGWKLRHYPKAEYLDLGWDLPFGIEPKIKDQKMKREHRKRRQRKDLRIHLSLEEC